MVYEGVNTETNSPTQQIGAQRQLIRVHPSGVPFTSHPISILSSSTLLLLPLLFLDPLAPQIPRFPNSQIPETRFQIPDPRSQIPDPGTRIPNPRSQIPDPGSQIRDPKSRIPDPSPGSRIPDPRSEIRDPRSQIRKTYEELWVSLLVFLWFYVPGALRDYFSAIRGSPGSAKPEENP